MNEALIKAIEALAEIQKAAGKDYPVRNDIKDETLEEEEYRSAKDTEHKDGIPQERARADRAKMLDILRNFYREQHETLEGMDDFITLVGVYCNDYIRWNLHQALPEEKDFAITELFDVITDENLQTCVCMIQLGINSGMYDGFKIFYDASTHYPYSLPNLYLFLRYAIKYGELKEGESEERWAMCMVDCLARMNQSLREYCLGTSSFLKPNAVYDENPLPYAIFIDEEDYHKARLAEKFYMNVKTLLSLSKTMDTKHPKQEEVFDLVFARQSIQECMEGMEMQEKEAADEEKETDEEDADDEEDDGGEGDPYRDDAPLYRLYFLSIPCKIDWGKKTLSNVMNVMAGRQRATYEKELAQQSKNKIVQEFTHTYKNLKATTLYDIAKTLLAKPGEEEKRLGRTLLLEYSNKKAMTKDVFMMQLRYDRDTKRLRESLQKSCYPASASDLTKTTKHIEDLVEQALVTCLVSIFYDKSQAQDDVRMPFCRSFPKSTLQQMFFSFEQDVMQEHARAIDLLRTHGLDITIDGSPAWDTLAFLPDEYAAIFLKDIFVELIVNAIKYGDLHQGIHFSFTAQDDALLVSAANMLPKNARRSGTRIGLTSIEDTLSVLWGDDVLAQEQHLQTTIEKERFFIRLSLPRTAFCQERG